MFLLLKGNFITSQRTSQMEVFSTGTTAGKRKVMKKCN